MSNYMFLEFNLLGEAHQEDLALLLADASAKSSLIGNKKLTKNEFFCLLLAANGLTSLETSKVLSLAKDTIESHRKKIRHKLNCKNMTHAVFQAIRYELCIS